MERFVEIFNIVWLGFLSSKVLALLNLVKIAAKNIRH